MTLDSEREPEMFPEVQNTQITSESLVGLLLSAKIPHPFFKPGTSLISQSLRH